VKLRPDEKTLARALLASGRVDRLSMQSALGLLKSQRGEGSSTTLQDILIKRGLASVEDIAGVLEPGRKRHRGRPEPLGDSWKAYSAADSVSFVDSLERRRKRKKKLPRPLNKGSDCDEVQPLLGEAPAEKALFDKNSLLAAGFALEETAAGSSGAGDAIDHDDLTLTLDTHKAAEAALAHIKARASVERARSASRQRERKRSKGRRVLSGLAVAVAVSLMAVLFLIFRAEPKPGNAGKDQAASNVGRDQESAVQTSADQSIAGIIEKAINLERGESFGDALTLWLELKNQDTSSLTRAQRKLLAQSIRRLGRLDAFKIALEEAITKVEELRQGGHLREAIELLSGVIDSYPNLPPSSIGNRGKKLLVEIFDESNTASNNAGSKIPRPSAFRGAKAKPKAAPKREPDRVKKLILGAEPGERIRRFRALMARGKQRVEKTGRSIVKQRQLRDAHVQEEAKRAVEASRKRPLTVKISKRYTLNNAVVKRYSSRGFTLDSKGTEISFLWSSADPQLAYRIRKLGAQNNPQSLLDLGRFCVEKRLFTEARKAYKRALDIDRSLFSKVPDLESLEQETRLFQGRFQSLGGGLIDLFYDFRSKSQLKDFDNGTKSSIKAGRLELKGAKIFPFILKNLIFENRVSLTLSPRSASRKALLAFGIMEASKARRGLLFAYQPQAQGLVLLLWENGGTKPLGKPSRLARNPKRLDFDWKDGIVKVRADGRKIFQSPWLHSESRVRVVLAGISRGEDVVSFNSLNVKGDVGRVWLRKTLGAAEARLRAVMAGAEDLPIFTRNSQNKRQHDMRKRQLSAEDSYSLRPVKKAIRARYFKAVKLVSSQKIKSYLAGLTILAEVTDECPGFAAAHYRLAVGQRRLGRHSLAMTNIDIALASCPHFYEAMALKSQMLLDRKKRDEALKWAQQTLDIKPDNSLARYVKGRLAFLASQLKTALKGLELSAALDPWNDDAINLKRNIRHVLDGPPWKRTFVHETLNYRVETDISRTKAEYYGRHLEAIRSFYCEQFGVSPYTEIKKRARVLIFDTREGFHSYAKLTTDDRVESFLGYYHPRFQQLLLYEDRRDVKGTDTLRVLYHEGLHQFTHGFIPQMPFWLAEGLAEYYAGSRIESGAVTARGLLHKGRVRDLQRYLAGRSHIPFKKLMLESPAEFYSGAVAVKYAQAWSMCHFFCHGSNGRYQALLSRYLRLLKENHSAADAFKKTFAEIDIKACEQRWRKHIKSWR
jgi:tetratricopeptide (TPR) repeat protein